MTMKEFWNLYKYRPVTYTTRKGLEYIRKLLRKDGYYDDDFVIE